MRALIRFVIFTMVAHAQDSKPLGEIDFFGHMGLDVNAIRTALPVREGEQFPPAGMRSSDQLKRTISERVRSVLGKEPTDVAFVCCDHQQRWMIYIGLPGLSSRPVQYNPAPRGNIRLPAAAAKLHDDLNTAWMNAVVSGNAHEDHSQGFALSAEPKLRSKQLAARDFALNNDRMIQKVIADSSSAKDRGIAATFLGYARQSRTQLDALLRVCLDRDAEVRNNATRALGVLLAAKPELAADVPVDPFIALIASGTWSDRNKGVMVLDALTAKRDPAVLNELKTKGADAFIEMARWRSRGHAYTARIILGRIAGLPDERARELAEADHVEAIIQAVNR